MEEIAIGAKLLAWGKSLLTNPYVLGVLATIAAIGGGLIFFHHEVNKKADVKIEQHDQIATKTATDTKDKATTAAHKIDNKYDALAAKTAKDYDHVRTNYDTPAAAASADAPLDPAILDTLNQLAGMHSDSPSDGVSNSPD